MLRKGCRKPGKTEGSHGKMVGSQGKPGKPGEASSRAWYQVAKKELEMWEARGSQGKQVAGLGIK